ncbi:hypothetical protein GCM10027168_17130 [Streptomyces capparidis]
MTAVFVGVRHHSPACARVVASAIETLRPAYVLVEGPADFNDRLDELLLGHELPIAVYTSYRDEQRTHASWTPFCAYSPEWVAVTAGRACGAEVRFIDLPAWHPAFTARGNRYADAELRYSEVVTRLCTAFTVDNADALWDHLFEVEGTEQAAWGPGPGPGPEGEGLRPGPEREALLAPASRGQSHGEPGGDEHASRPGSEEQTPRAPGAGGRSPRRGFEGRSPSASGGSPLSPPTSPDLRPEGPREGGSSGPEGRGSGSQPGSEGETPPAPGARGRSPQRSPSASGGTDPGTPPLSHRLDAYFELVRGESPVGEEETAREAYMARWVRAAVAAAGGRPVLVVTGGFHAPALRRALAAERAEAEPWPEIPAPPDGAVGGSWLVPYSFRRLDAFTGYQSGMPSPGYYQRLWDDGPERAAAGLVRDVVTRLRRRGQAVSTADLIAARALSEGLARLRGHRVPGRTDVLDGLVGALVSDDLDQRLPWTTDGPLAPGAHPVVAEMVAALSGDRTGRLHPDTPAPPLVGHVTAELARLRLDREGPLRLDLTDPPDLERSRALHRLRVLGIPGYERTAGPVTGADPVLDERWELSPSELRLSGLLEAGAHGATLEEAAAAVLRERAADAGSVPERLTDVLFDAALCGLTELSDDVVETIGSGIGAAVDIGALGEVLATVLGLWRHDRLLGTARSPVFGAVVTECVARVLWLAEAVRGGPAPADRPRLRALAAVRDAVLHAGPALGLDRGAALGTARRIAATPDAPPDLRGAAFGFTWSLGEGGDPAGAVGGMSAPGVLGDWLAGLFALARAEVLSHDEGTEGDGGLLGVLDALVAAMPAAEFLVALPALRQAFAWFPPRERETIARGLLERRGLPASGRALTRTVTDPLLTAEALALEEKVEHLLSREALLTPAEPGPSESLEGTP